MNRVWVVVLLVGCGSLTPPRMDAGSTGAGQGTGGSGGGNAVGGGQGGGSSSGGGVGGSTGGSGGGAPATFTFTRVAAVDGGCFTALTGSPDGTLWLGSQAALYAFDGTLHELSASPTPITSLAVSGGDVIGAAGDAGIIECPSCSTSSTGFFSSPRSLPVRGVCAANGWAFAVGSDAVTNNSVIWKRTGSTWTQVFYGVNVEKAEACVVSSTLAEFVGNGSVHGLELLDGGATTNEYDSFSPPTGGDAVLHAVTTYQDTFFAVGSGPHVFERVRKDAWRVSVAYLMAPNAFLSAASLPGSGVLAGGTATAAGSFGLFTPGGSFSFVAQPRPEVHGLWARDANTFFVAGCEAGNAVLYRATR